MALARSIASHHAAPWRDEHTDERYQYVVGPKAERTGGGSLARSGTA